MLTALLISIVVNVALLLVIRHVTTKSKPCSIGQPVTYDVNRCNELNFVDINNKLNALADEIGVVFDYTTTQRLIKRKTK